MNRFRTFTERNSKKTNCPLEIRWPFLSQLCESNTKTDVICHVSTKVIPAQVSIAPLPMSSEERKSFWWANKSLSLKMPLWQKPILTSKSEPSIFKDNEVHLQLVHDRDLKTSLKCPPDQEQNLDPMTSKLRHF